MVDQAVTERTLQDLHALGVRLALDDFGSGHSSLGQLARTLPISILKLDRSFVHGMSCERDRGIITAAAALAEALQMSSVAEGVESAEQADALAAMGFAYAQGFYFHTPAGADEILTRLRPGRFSGPTTTNRPGRGPRRLVDAERRSRSGHRHRSP